MAIVWPGFFAGVLPLEKSVNFPLQDGESRHCGRGGGLWVIQLWRGPGLYSGPRLYSGGGGGAGGLDLVDGVTDDGVRTVPLSFKAIVELIQFVGQAQVVGARGVRFVIRDLSERLIGEHMLCILHVGLRCNVNTNE